MEPKAAKCFVIQQFDDGGFFDKRYYETIAPILNECNLDTKRADQILGTKPIIDKIENAIRDADICIAEVSTDNPNVWLEVGYAYSLNKTIILLCDREIRAELPFDIRHRPIIFYTTKYQSGYSDLAKKLKEEVKEFLREFKKTTDKKEPAFIDTVVAGNDDDLTTNDLLVLSILMADWASNPSGSSHWQIKNKASDFSLNDMEVGLVLAKLLRDGFIQSNTESDYNGETYLAYRLTEFGVGWILKNKNRVEALIKSDKNSLVTSNEEIPF